MYGREIRFQGTFHSYTSRQLEGIVLDRIVVNNNTVYLVQITKVDENMKNGNTLLLNRIIQLDPLRIIEILPRFRGSNLEKS